MLNAVLKNERNVKGTLPMPTQEERLETLEYGLKQYKTETIKAYGEMAMEITMVKGLTEDAVKRLMTLRTALDQQMAEMKQDIHQLQMGMAEMKQDIHQLQMGFDAHTVLLNEHTTRFDRLETLLAQILVRLPEKP
jgi:chromosome segregation ATPase